MWSVCLGARLREEELPMEYIGFSLRCRDASKHARPLKARAGAILSLPPHSVGKSNHMVKPNVKS